MELKKHLEIAGQKRNPPWNEGDPMLNLTANGFCKNCGAWKEEQEEEEEEIQVFQINSFGLSIN